MLNKNIKFKQSYSRVEYCRHMLTTILILTLTLMLTLAFDLFNFAAFACLLPMDCNAVYVY